MTGYLAWRNERASAQGHTYRFVLPEREHWLNLIRSDGERRFAWGQYFRSNYAKSCFARAQPRPEPVLRYAYDETFHGLHDTAGGVSEMCSGWFWEEREERPVCGGSWVYAEPVRFELKYMAGIETYRRREFIGFRLAIETD